MAVATDERRCGHEVSREEGLALLDRAPQKRLNMRAQEFVAAWNAGQFAGKADNSKVSRVAMLLPFAR
ncbi:MAG: hypothetical protein ACR2JY_07495 [Chloroflexota bacterium]